MRATEKMTAAEAQTFDRYSAANAAQVLEQRGCGCQPYQDVFTYRRWAAQGFQVQKGERAIRIPTIRNIKVEEPDGSEGTRRLRRLAFVFCRHQVAASEGGAS